MSEKGKQGLRVLGLALLLGLLGDALLRETPWGLNTALWTCVLVASILLLAKYREAPLTGEGRLMAVPILLFGAGFAWRDSPVLKSLDAVSLLVALALLTYRGHAGRIKIAGFMEYVKGVLVTLLEASIGLWELALRDIPWAQLPRGAWSKNAASVGRGLLIAVPILLLFGALFVSADAVFEKFVSSAFHIDADNLFSHLAISGLCAWLVAGILRAMMLREQVESITPPPVIRRPLLGMVEMGIAMGLVNLLFLCFVLIQVRYLFGGAALVHARTGLTYSEYARRGFFELVTVATLVLPLLLLAHGQVDSSIPAHRRTYRVLAGIQIALLLVVMASAVQRMRLYQSGYGLTELRFYVTAFMGWLAVVFGWFCATVLRGRRARFAYGALISAFCAVGLLHALNPDAVIVQSNVRLAEAGHAFDSRYAVSLSADSVPTLVAELSGLASTQRADTSARLLSRWAPGNKEDWRVWNWSRKQAKDSIKRHRPALAQLAGTTSVADIPAARDYR
jgi:hypothetical protein